jgi:UDP-N-acetylglucosamine acyltransferase
MTKVHGTAVVEDGASLGADVEIGPYCYVGPHVTLGNGVLLKPNVVVEGHTQIGDHTIIHSFSSLGQGPQVKGHDDDTTTLVIGKNNEIREHVTMHPGSKTGRRKTVIGDNNMFMVGAHIAHDCIIGNNVTFANNATIGGHVTVGNFVNLGGLCAVHQWSRIGDFSFVGGMAGLEGDLIPYGSCKANRAYLNGLNLVGMKRSQMSRETINQLRSAFKVIFSQEGLFQDRVREAAKVYAECTEVMSIVKFIEDAKSRSICMPKLERGS